MKFRAIITGRRKTNKYAEEGFIYLYSYRVVDESGRTHAADNARGWQHILKQALSDVTVCKRAWSLGLIK